MRPEHLAELRDLLDAAGFDSDPADFSRFGSARQLYNFHADKRRRILGDTVSTHNPALRESATFDRGVIAEIQRAAETGIYDISGWGTRKPPHFDDLLFLGASMSRSPLEGCRERCDTDVVLGDRHAERTSAC